jgi:trehalose 6-phosphate synthase/phosphatase
MNPSHAAQGRLFLVSNRLPVTLKEGPGGFSASLSAGGLATGLAGLHRESGGAWIGWPGISNPDASLSEEIHRALGAENLVGVGLTPDEHRGYYQNISNQCIWPLFHYFKERMRFKDADWDEYVAVNRRFADVVLEQVEPGDTVFVQDFHLALVPRMLREAGRDLCIGYFLHIPFPSSEIFRIFPKREELLNGILGADLVAFHTMGYVRHFRSSVAHILGLETRSTSVLTDGREVRLMARPLAIDSHLWEKSADTEEERAIADYSAYLKEMAGKRSIILGVERLDYTKGIPERLLAFRALLASDPTWVERVMMIQVAVPSRAEVSDYKELKDEIDRLAGAINSEFGRPGVQPLHYMYQSVPRAELRAFYRSAQVALVTPLRDGLNLVAKEFVASRHADDGVLVLGESAGAAWELGESLRVNPFDPSDMVRGIKKALTMTREEQQRRMRPMRERLAQVTVEDWARDCLAAIRSSHRTSVGPAPLDEARQAECLASWRACLESKGAALFLDYDGTLREFTDSPDEAQPSTAILALLGRLATLNHVQTWIVSGRSAAQLDDWLGKTGVGLVAEHGASLRPPGATAFEPLFETGNLPWKPEARAILEEFTARVPGSRIEEKALGIAWHYRKADPVLGAWQAGELFEHLAEIFMDQGVQIMRGSRVLEVRPAHVNKGHAVGTILAKNSVMPGFLLAAGDDQTDESLFRALAAPAWTLLVGARPSAARWRLESPAACRDLLNALVVSSARPARVE